MGRDATPDQPVFYSCVLEPLVCDPSVLFSHYDWQMWRLEPPVQLVRDSNDLGLERPVLPKPPVGAPRGEWCKGITTMSVALSGVSDLTGGLQSRAVISSSPSSISCGDGGGELPIVAVRLSNSGLW